VTQETPRKYTKPTHTKNNLAGDPRLDRKMMQRMTQEKMGIVNWRQVARDRDGWRRATREVLILLVQWGHKRIWHSHERAQQDREKQN
jgi:hypothetical protein